MGQSACPTRACSWSRSTPSPLCCSSNRTRNGPSRQRRRERREEARRLAAKEAVLVDSEHAEEAEDRQVEVATADEAETDLNNIEAAVKVVEQVNVSVEDEFCTNDEYFSKLENNVKMKCSIQLVPENPCKIELFRDTVAKYFAEKKDIIESVVNCQVEHSGQAVRLESIVKRKLWINYFSEPKENYYDLPGVKKRVHDFRDLANCDRTEV